MVTRCKLSNGWGIKEKRHSEMVTGELVIEKHANGTKEWSVKMIWGRRGSRPIFYSEVLYTIFPTRWHYAALNTKVVLLFYQYYIDQNHLEMSRNLRNHHQDCRQGFWNNKSRLLLQNKTCLRTFLICHPRRSNHQISDLIYHCKLSIIYSVLSFLQWWSKCYFKASSMLLGMSLCSKILYT